MHEPLVFVMIGAGLFFLPVLVSLLWPVLGLTLSAVVLLVMAAVTTFAGASSGLGAALAAPVAAIFTVGSLVCAGMAGAVRIAMPFFRQYR